MAPADSGPGRLGRAGERAAEAYLRRRGWRVLKRNYRFGRKEVDLIVLRDGVIAFVEVKSRAGAGYGDPLEAITWKKRREIETVALHFLTRSDLGDVRVRFDAVAVLRRAEKLWIRHVEDAWRPDAR